MSLRKSERKYDIRYNQLRVRSYICRQCDSSFTHLDLFKKHGHATSRHIQSTQQIQMRITNNLSAADQQYNSNKLEPNNEYEQLIDRIRIIEEKQGNMNLTNMSRYAGQQIIRQQITVLSAEIGDYLTHISKARLQIAFHNANSEGIDIIRAKMLIKMSLVQQIDELKFECMADSYRESFKKHWERIKTEIQQKEAQTISRYRHGYKFWIKYENRHFQYLHSIVNDLKKLNAYEFRCANDFYSWMLKSTDLFPYLRPLPQIVFRKHKIIRPEFEKIDLQQVKKHVYKLIKDNLLIEATDLWMATTMGLRKPELLTIKFNLGNRPLVDSVQVIQKKNSHLCKRVVPHSLKKLIILSDASYPLTKDRYTRLMRYCIQHFHRFYGLRSLCITSLILAAIESNEHHHRISTTINYYVDDQKEELINKIFSLDIPGEDPPKSFIILRLDRSKNWIEIPSKNQNLEEIEEEIKDAHLLPANELNQIIDPHQKSQIEEESKIFHEFNLQLDEADYSSLSQAIASKIDDPDAESILSMNSPKEESIVETANLIYGLDIMVLQSGPENHPRQNTETNPDNFLIVSKNDGSYRISDNDPIVVVNHELKMKLRAKKRKTLAEDSLAQFTLIKPKCSSCRDSLIMEPCSASNHYYFKCAACPHVVDHKCSNNDGIEQELNIENLIFPEYTSTQIEPNLKMVSLQSEPNNFELIIAKQRTIIQKPIYAHDITSIQTKIPIASANLSRIICWNRSNEHYLPFSIFQCQIGYGVRSEVNLQANTLICTYMGKICTNQSLQIAENDSLFTLGWIKQQNRIRQLIINPQHYSNIGRYLNTGPSLDQSNCSASICLYNVEVNSRKAQSYEICVIISSNQFIYAGEELIYFYGSQYIRSAQMKGVEILPRNSTQIGSPGKTKIIKKLPATPSKQLQTTPSKKLLATSSKKQSTAFSKRQLHILQ